MPKIHPKTLLFETLFGRWRRSRSGPLREGYSILLAMPSDMPFLLRFALEGLRAMDTPNCNQIVVVPDGFSDLDGRAFRAVIAGFDDPRIELTRIRPGVHFFIHRVQKRRSHKTAANWSHWAQIVEGTACASSEYAFLHDADAFFVDADGLERSYVESRARGMFTLGVQSRLDAYFDEIGYTIPGTWEMMYSVPWARSRSPFLLKGQRRDTPKGSYVFDTMLYPQYLDHPTGKIGVMADPPRLVHFHGAVTTYRVYRDRAGESVVDTIFRLLLLSILEDLVPAPDGSRILPPPDELARGLADPSAPVTYGGEVPSQEYPGFRRQVEDLCQAPTFQGERAERVRAHLRPFDEHFAGWKDVPVPVEDTRLLKPEEARTHGLG
jgi:hypothetical protein